MEYLSDGLVCENAAVVTDSQSLSMLYLYVCFDR